MVCLEVDKVVCFSGRGCLSVQRNYYGSSLLFSIREETIYNVLHKSIKHHMPKTRQHQGTRLMHAPRSVCRSLSLMMGHAVLGRPTRVTAALFECNQVVPEMEGRRIISILKS